MQQLLVYNKMKQYRQIQLYMCCKVLQYEHRKDYSKLWQTKQTITTCVDHMDTHILQLSWEQKCFIHSLWFTCNWQVWASTNQKQKMLWEVNFSSRFCSDRMKLLQVWVYTRCFHLWKTTSWTKLSNPAHTAAGAPESLFTSSLYFSLRSSSLCSSCYCSLSLSLSCLCPCRSQVALCASLPKHRWHSGCLQEKANEVSCQSKIWLLIWPLQQGTAEEEEDQCTCLQLLTSDHVTVC